MADQSFQPLLLIVLFGNLYASEIFAKRFMAEDVIGFAVFGQQSGAVD